MLASVYAEVDSTRESLERSSFGDRSQTDDNEKVIPTQNLATIESFSRSPVNVRSLQTGRIRLPPIDSGGQVSNVTGKNTDFKNSEERDDLSSEGHDPLQVKTHTVSPFKGVDPASQVVNETASSGEIKARIRSGDQGQRMIVTNRLLQNRLNRGRTTTTADPISGHSDEKSDDSDKNTTPARNLPSKNRMNSFRTTARSSTPSTENSGEVDDSIKKIETATVKPIQTTTIRNSISRNGFGRFRTTTEPAPVSSNSNEDSGLTNQTVTTTVRSFTSSNRFSRVRTTTVPTSDTSAEEVELASVVPTTTARSLVLGNLFGRFRTTTPIPRDSNENDDAVEEIQTTTVRNSVSKSRINRFQTTTSSKPVTQESQEQVNVITTTQTPVIRKSLSGNRFNRIRTTTTVIPISDTSDEVDDSANVTQITRSRTLITGNRLGRFRTTTFAPVSMKDSEEQDESVSTTTTTTTRTSAFRNRLNAIRTTTSPTILHDSIEEEDSLKKTSTITAQNLPSRVRFGLTRTTMTPAVISTNSDEDNDVVNKTETTTKRRFLTGKRFGVLRTTVPPPILTTSQNSDEDVDSANANQTTTTPSSLSGNHFKGFRITTRTPVPKDSEEQVSLVKKTQTTVRNSLLRNRSSRLQATTSTPTIGNFTEQVDSDNGTQTSSNTSSHIAIPVTTSRDSDEQEETNNSTGTTTARTRVTLKYFNRYRTTTDRKLTSENSDEQVDRSVSTTQMTSNVQIPSTTGRSSSTPPGKATSSPETANLGRKDRAIIYNTKTNIDVNHLNDFQTEAPVPAHNYFTARHSDETDDVSEDEDISSLPYPYIHYRTTTVVPFTTDPDEENSDEVDSLESHDTVTDKPGDSAELSKDGMIAMMVPNAANILMAKKSVDSSVEIIFFVSNNSESIRNQTATLLRSAKLLTDSDEGNDVSAEGEGSGAIPDDDVPTTSVHQYARILGSEEGNDASIESQISDKVPHLDVQNPNDSVEQGVYESEERSNISTETKVSNRVLTGGLKVDNQTESEEENVNNVTESNEANTVSAESAVNEGTVDIRQDRNKTSAEVPQDSDENDESSLEVDVSKLPEIKKLLSDAENEGASPDVEDRTAAGSGENRAVYPDIDSFMKVDVNHHTTSPAAKLNETMIEDANKKNEVNMKIRELLKNPIVQERLHERLQTIDGRLKDSKSARVKRLIEKYLAALAKLSPSSNAAKSISFSVFFPLIITCLLFGFS